MADHNPTPGPRPQEGADPSPRTAGPATRSQACMRCWKRKQKCDRLLPTCSACAELGVECLARAPDVASMFSEEAGLTHASLNSYVDLLERRVVELEQDVQSPPKRRARADSRQDVPADALDRPRRTHRGSTSTPATLEGSAANVEDSSVRNTMGAIGFLSNSAMSEPAATTSGPGEAGNTPQRLAQTEILLAALAIAGHDPSTASPSQPPLVLDEDQVPLNRELLVSHVRAATEHSLYMAYLNGNQILEDFESVVARHRDRQRSTAIQPLSRFNAYMAAAIGIMMSPESSGLAFLATSLHAAAVKTLAASVRPAHTLDALHCTAMLLVYSLFSPTGGSAWHLMDLAMKTAITLGLHKEASPQLGSECIGDYDVKWLFWTLYVYDRWLSSVMDRPFSIQDSDISVPVPPEREDPNSPEVDASRHKEGHCRHLIRHAQLISNVRSAADARTMFAYSNLCFWRECPPLPRHTGQSIEEWRDTVQQLSCRILMQIVRPVPQAEPESALLPGSHLDVEADTIDSARRLIDRMYARSRERRLASSFLDAYDVLSAAIVFVCLSRRLGRESPDVSTQVFDTVNKASAIITDISGRFHALRIFQELLLDLSARMMAESSSIPQASRTPALKITATIPRRLRQFIQHAFPEESSLPPLL